MDRVAWLTCLLVLAHGRIYERCELARDLQSLGVNLKRISTWVCIAFHESRFDTAATNLYSGDHGIFQISELFWCGPGKACNLPCSSLRDADISDDLECALQIYEEHTRLQGDGFQAWVVYPTYCAHNTKKYLVDCDMNIKSSVPLTRSWDFSYLETKNQTEYKENSLPRYLEIANIFKGYNNMYSRNIEPAVRYNSKIRNIDDLKIPTILSNKLQTFNEASTTTTTVATTTVYVPPVVPWRTIETNQFRKKNLNRNKNYERPNGIQEEYIPVRRNYTINSHVNTLHYTSQTQLIENAVRSQPLIVTTTIKPSFTTTITPSSLNKTKSQVISSDINRVTGSATQSPFVATPSSSTTNPPFVRTTPRWNTIATATTKSTTVAPTTSRWNTIAPETKRWDSITPVTTFRWATPASTKWTTTAPANTRWTTITPATTRWTTIAPVTTKWTTTTKKQTERLTTKLQTSTTPTFKLSRKNNEETTKSTATRAVPKTFSWYTSKPSSSSTKSQTTTSSPILNATTKRTETTTRKPRITQSIFDLYLNPTKPPQLTPLQFNSQPASKFRLNIFASGTTTTSPPKSTTSRTEKDNSGSSKNQIKRHNI